MKMEELLRAAVEKQAADIFLIPGMPLSYRIGGKIINHNDEKIFPQEMDKLIRSYDSGRIIRETGICPG